jgi:type I restriction enzyme M protein
MLVYSREYVEEHGEDARNLALYGQENNGTTWAITKMNMILHGINNADIANEDTLAAPQHKDDSGELLRFDRLLTNPPPRRPLPRRRPGARDSRPCRQVRRVRHRRG